MADADAGWVTMHGPKVEHKRRQGELNAALACGGGTEQIDDPEAERYAAEALARASAAAQTSEVGAARV